MWERRPPAMPVVDRERPCRDSRRKSGRPARPEGMRSLTVAAVTRRAGPGRNCVERGACPRTVGGNRRPRAERENRPLRRVTGLNAGAGGLDRSAEKVDNFHREMYYRNQGAVWTACPRHGWELPDFGKGKRDPERRLEAPTGGRKDARTRPATATKWLPLSGKGSGDLGSRGAGDAGLCGGQTGPFVEAGGLRRPGIRRKRSVSQHSSIVPRAVPRLPVRAAAPKPRSRRHPNAW